MYLYSTLYINSLNSIIACVNPYYIMRRSTSYRYKLNTIRSSNCNSSSKLNLQLTLILLNFPITYLIPYYHPNLHRCKLAALEVMWEPKSLLVLLCITVRYGGSTNISDYAESY